MENKKHYLRNIFIIILLLFLFMAVFFATSVVITAVKNPAYSIKKCASHVALDIKQTILEYTKKDTKINMLRHLPISLPSFLAEDKNETYQLTDQEEPLLIGGAANIVFYSQDDPRWKDLKYGYTDSIGTYGCGPTAMAMIVSSLTEESYNPVKMSKWAFDNGYFCRGSGSYHSIIPKGARSFGLQVQSLKEHTSQKLVEELATGKLIVALMQGGHFSASGGHFVILRSVTLEGQILIADPKSLENSLIPWDPEIFIKEAKYSASDGGPFWSIQP